MANTPHTSTVRHWYKLDSEQHFHLEGTNFGSVRTVKLVESTGSIVWDPEEVTTFVEKTPTVLRFVSTPKARQKPKVPVRSTGNLTITVTNPDGPEPTVVASLYD